MQTIRAESLAFQITDGGSDRIIQLWGELDLASAPVCRRALHSLLDDGDGDIVIDLRGLTFLDSVGLCTLLHAHLTGAEYGTRVSFIRGDRVVQRVFEITHMDVRVDWADPVERLLPVA